MKIITSVNNASPAFLFETSQMSPNGETILRVKVQAPYNYDMTYVDITVDPEQDTLHDVKTQISQELCKLYNYNPNTFNSYYFAAPMFAWAENIPIAQHMKNPFREFAPTLYMTNSHLYSMF